MDIPYYHPHITARESEVLLKKSQENGKFLLRNSTSSPGIYSISVYSSMNDFVCHYRITEEENAGEKCYYIQGFGDKCHAMDIPSLVQKLIELGTDGLDVPLCRPLTIDKKAPLAPKPLPVPRKPKDVNYKPVYGSASKEIERENLYCELNLQDAVSDTSRNAEPSIPSAETSTAKPNPFLEEALLRENSKKKDLRISRPSESRHDSYVEVLYENSSNAQGGSSNRPVASVKPRLSSESDYIHPVSSGSTPRPERIDQYTRPDTSNPITRCVTLTIESIQKLTLKKMSPDKSTHVLFKELDGALNKGTGSKGYQTFRRTLKIHVNEKKFTLDRADGNKMKLSSYASQYGDVEVLKLLVDYGEDTKVFDGNGVALIHYASAAGQIEVIRYLIDLNIRNRELKDYNGNRPIHYAIANLKLATIKELHHLGANLNTQNKEGYTALDFSRGMRACTNTRELKAIIDVLEKVMVLDANMPYDAERIRLQEESMVQRVKEEVVKETNDMLEKTKQEFTEKHDEVKKKVNEGMETYIIKAVDKISQQVNDIRIDIQNTYSQVYAHQPVSYGGAQGPAGHLGIPTTPRPPVAGHGQTLPNSMVDLRRQGSYCDVIPENYQPEYHPQNSYMPSQDRNYIQKIKSTPNLSSGNYGTRHTTYNNFDDIDTARYESYTEIEMLTAEDKTQLQKMFHHFVENAKVCDISAKLCSEDIITMDMQKKWYEKKISEKDAATELLHHIMKSSKQTCKRLKEILDDNRQQHIAQMLPKIN